MKEIYLKNISDEIADSYTRAFGISNTISEDLSELIMADLRDALHNFISFEIEETRNPEYKPIAEYNICDQFEDCVVMYADKLTELVEDSINYFFKKNDIEVPVPVQTVHKEITAILMNNLSGCEHGADYIIPLEILKDSLSFDEHGFAAEDFVQKVRNDCNLNEFGTSIVERNIAVVERNANSIDQIVYDLSDVMGIVSPKMIAAFCHDSILSKGMREEKQKYWDAQGSEKTNKKINEDMEYA